MSKVACIGLDCGSSACKAALLIDDELIATTLQPTGWNLEKTLIESVNELIKMASLQREDVRIAVTGYGRKNCTFADKTITEITCHAKGGAYLFPEVQTILDIGGQDSKVIRVDQGKVLSFQMNDKCAAGTGRFLEMSAERLDMDFSMFALLNSMADYTSLTSMCAVFADSEIISLLGAGKAREEIALGILHSISQRIFSLTQRIEPRAPLMMTGGLARIDALIQIMEKQFAQNIYISPLSPFCGAIGAALLV